MVGGSSIKTTDLASDNIDDHPTFSTNTKRTFNQDHMGRELMSTEWTDEKHSLYLKSMEASFVKDLHESYNLLGYQIEKPLDFKLARQKMDTCTSSGQFKVIQHGCWEKINFERTRPPSLKPEDPCVLLLNPWIQHFRSPHGHQIVASSTLHEKVELAAHQLSYDDSTEVTDQNFIDDEDVEEKETYTSNPKRIKIENSTVPTPMNDQVVP